LEKRKPKSKLSKLAISEAQKNFTIGSLITSGWEIISRAIERKRVYP